MYFQPKVIYRNPGEKREHSVMRYVGTRVLRSNKNFLCALTGQTGTGKSWLGISLCEIHAKRNNIPFDVNLHTIHTLRQLLQLIREKELNKNIQIGTPLLFEEPQDAANSRNWQSESNKMLSLLLSTFRNQRLVVFFSTPYMSMIDKQSRILFHGEFKVLGFDKNTGITSVKPRFLEYNGDYDKFYKKKLIIDYAIEGKLYRGHELVSKWAVPRASKELLDEYEAIKQKYSVDLIERLWQQAEKSAGTTKKVRDTSRGDDLFKVLELYNKHGENFVLIQRELPHITPLSLDRMVRMAKKSLKIDAITAQ